MIKGEIKLDKDYTFITDVNARPLMECGHVALYQKAFNDDGNIIEVPVCLKCGCHTVEPKTINFKRRKARCPMCGTEVRSSLNLDGFHYFKNKEHDVFYCGCANDTLIKAVMKTANS